MTVPIIIGIAAVPAGLEDVFDDLKIEANEGEMVNEFDNIVVGNDVMLNRKRPKVKKNYILLHQNLTLGDKKRYQRARTLPNLLAAIPSLMAPGPS